MSAVRRRVLPVVLFALVAAVVAGCGRKGEITDLRPPPPPQAETPAPGTGG